MNLKGRTAIVTGGAAGIGAAIGHRLAADGASVLVADIDADAAEHTAQAIRAAGGVAVAQAADVTIESDARRLVDTARDELGGVNILVNNVGVVSRPGSALEIDESEWDRVWDANVKGGFLCSKHAIAHMVDHGGGVVLFTASAAGLVGAQGQLLYCATKAAVINLVRSMALDHGRQGVRVNCVCPGPTLTPTLLAEVPNEEALAMRSSMIPLDGRLAKPEEIAAVFAFLASDEASFVTGQAFVADGGLTAGMFRPTPPPARTAS